MSNLIEIRPGRRVHIALYQVDPSAPTIFMIHGLGGRGQQWREQITHFQGRYNLIVPDLLGHGESEKPKPEQDNPYDFSEFNQDVQALFAKYAGVRNYVFGHSYGGVFSVFLTKENLSKIQKMVLITPMSCRPIPNIPLIYNLPTALLELLRPYLDKSFEKLSFVPGDDPKLLEEERKARERNPIYLIKAILQGMRDIPALSLNPIDLPSLVISAKEDKLIPPQGVERFYDNLPQHQIHILENAAHMVHLEKAAEVNGLLDRFLAL